MTLQELDTINSISINAGFDFHDIICMIANGASAFGLLEAMAGENTDRFKMLLDSIDTILGKEHERRWEHD